MLITFSWLYSLFLAIDANFCVKRRAVSSDETDPSLLQGWAYFVEENSYKSHLSDRAGETQEVRFVWLIVLVYLLMFRLAEEHLLQP